MTIEVQQLLERSFVISINYYTYLSFCKQFQEAQLDPIPRLFSGYKIKNELYKDAGFIKTSDVFNCSFSHFNIIKMAQTLNWPYVCIFEDDAEPCEDCFNKLSRYLTDLPNNLDILKLGIISTGDTQPIRQYGRLLKYKQSYGAHAYIVFQQYYSNYFEKMKFNSNLVADNDLVNDIYRNIYSTQDVLFTQKNISGRMHDDIQDMQTKYLECLKRNLKH